MVVDAHPIVPFFIVTVSPTCMARTLVSMIITEQLLYEVGVT